MIELALMHSKNNIQVSLYDRMPTPILYCVVTHINNVLRNT
ncbi:hypothetical protein SAMN04488029_4002 [Reichenbachiella faecimaris]|uniref:Uncharacterized protein n=1 Tax=Reichenbachiella faecimaris TaxID=692418 RepID=A0A1W2GRY5_REIFA|nr:hypothetical protein SAMN04488029_4002 [Reichenbachiella faecimaris]